MNLVSARFAAEAKSVNTAGVPQRAYLAAGLLAVMAVLSLAVDVPIASFVLRYHESGLLETLLDLLTQVEPFAHAAGVAVILVAIRVLDPARRRCLFRVAACAFGGGLAADVMKLIVMRRRPKAADEIANVWDTFEGWTPVLSDISAAAERAIQSFPSGHSAMAAGLAVALSWLYPRGRWFFLCLAALAALQRVVAGAHFPSDICAGAALGCLVAAMMLDPRLFGRAFTRFEARISS